MVDFLIHLEEKNCRVTLEKAPDDCSRKHSCRKQGFIYSIALADASSLEGRLINTVASCIALWDPIKVFFPDGKFMKICDVLVL